MLDIVIGNGYGMSEKFLQTPLNVYGGQIMPGTGLT